MPTYNGRTIVTMPDTPAPKSVEFADGWGVGSSLNPFTQQQQIQDWNANWMELQVTLPPMSQTDAQAWVTFLRSCRGIACVFQLPTTGTPSFASLVPSGAVPAGYWCLKNNQNKWSITDGLIHGFQFVIREAL
jgi:hypothetical protein